MTISQITAVLSLLLAFGVPYNTVNQVQGILEHTNTPVTAPIVETIPTLPPPSSASVLDCTPHLALSIKKEDGDISTGIDYEVDGIATIASGCTFDPQTNTSLQLPNVTYKGRITDWVRNKQSTLSNTTFTYYQGWGSGAGINASGEAITWTVGSIATSTTIPVGN